MKKAFDALQAKGLNYDFHDYKKQGIDADTLKIWLKEIGQDTVLNKKERLGANFQKKNKTVL